jgi:N-methylhydantoinase B
VKLTQQHNRPLDPIVLTVITNRLEGITREMGAGMLRSSRSPIFAENRDFVTAVFDKKLRMVGQTAYIPVLLGASPFAVEAISRDFGEEVREGDVMILNDPYRGNNHLPDISVVKPVFFDGQLEFWVLARGHHADIGGGGSAGYNAAAQTVWEEGLRIPPARLYDGGKYNRDVWNLILLNTRLPTLVEGDLSCQVGACKIGERSLIELLRRYGAGTLERAMDQMLDSTEAQMRAQIQEIPAGTYRTERKLDDSWDSGARPTIRLALHVNGDSLTIDFAGTDPQIPAYFNSSYPNTVSSCYIGLFSNFSSDIKINEGSMRPIHVVAPEGSLVNPLEGAPNTQCTVATCAVIVESVWQALTQARPHAAQAAWARSNTAVGSGLNPRTQRPIAFIYHFTKGGGGATDGFDGWSHISPVSSMGGSRVPDPELHELSTPNSILSYEYRKDSAGAGKWRGGYGSNFRVRFDSGGTLLSCQVGSISPETAPFGLAGGHDATPARMGIRKPGREATEFQRAAMYRPDSGDILECDSSGGGGYGDPYERPAELVLNDVLDELLSVEKARDSYGVIIDPENLSLDRERTRALRERRVSSRRS